MTNSKEAVAAEVTVRPHQLGQDVFRSVLPEEIDWKPFAAIPPSVRLDHQAMHKGSAIKKLQE